MARPAIRGHRLTREAKAEGIAYARAWRIRMKPHFDALYGTEPQRCGCCGQLVRGN